MKYSSSILVWQADYTPFGEATITTETITNNIRFPGQYYDEETGLHYNMMRYYDSQLGRYITADPLGVEDGPNVYGYVGGNPINRIDPTGEFIGIIPLIPPATAAFGKALAFLGSAALAGYGLSELTDFFEEDCDDEKPDCKKARKFHLKKAGITDEHSFKTEWGAVPNSRFDICACKDGSIVIKAQGNCGKPGPEIQTDVRWK